MNEMLPEEQNLLENNSNFANFINDFLFVDEEKNIQVRHYILTLKKCLRTYKFLINTLPSKFIISLHMLSLN